MQTKKIYVTGMHCQSCEKLLVSEFKNAKNVQDVKINLKDNTADIVYAGDFNFAEIKNTARKFNYDAFLEKPAGKNKSKWSDWANALFIVVAILFFFKILEDSGLVDGLKFNPDNLTLGVAFLVGLAASVSSCLAVVGSVVIAFAEKYQADGKNFYTGSVKPNLLFHAGRLATFFLLGGVLGALGGGINLSGNLVGIYTLIVAAIMLWLGLNILGILPPLSRLGIRMPGQFTGRWENLKKSEHGAAPLLLGALTFFLPCGFTQSMQIFALASGSFMSGALALFIFALGTAPVLLVVGISTAWTKNSKTAVFQKVAGILIILFAIYTFSNGLALKGVQNNLFAAVDKNPETETSPAKNAPADKSNEQIVKMSITARGFEPSTLQIKAGVPVKFIINGDGATGCTSRIIVPMFNITKNISKGENIIIFTPTQKGEIPFSCSMGMVRGKFIVN